MSGHSIGGNLTESLDGTQPDIAKERKKRMNNLNQIKIEDDGAHDVSIYIDKGDYWRQVYVDLPTTLGQIYKQFRDAPMIYVIVDGYMSGVIYRCGNYGNGEWQKYATTMGMA